MAMKWESKGVLIPLYITEKSPGEYRLRRKGITLKHNEMEKFKTMQWYGVMDEQLAWSVVAFKSL